MGHVAKTAGRHGGFETLQLSTQAAADVHRRSGSQHEFLRGSCCDQASSASPALARTGDGRQTEFPISRRVSAAWGEICVSRRTWTGDARIANFVRRSPTKGLKDEIASGDELPPVWPGRDGETRGIALEPLYKTAPAAALSAEALAVLIKEPDALAALPKSADLAVFVFDR